MVVTPYKTQLVRTGDDITAVIQQAIPHIPERSVLTIASKIFASSEGRFVPKQTGEKSEKHALVRQEADLYLEAEHSKYNLMHTIKRNLMFVNAGIDESNADNQYILWPKNPQLSVNLLWDSIKKTYNIRELGIIMTDSASRPLIWGVTGCSIAYCGIEPLKSYIGKPDLFGRLMVMEQVSVLQSLAAAGTFVTGEGDEQTPVALLTDIPHVTFQDHVPSEQELHALTIALEDDAYAPIVSAVPWKKGGSGKIP
jgi:F420-0:gamma-glutamyl ligase